MWFIQVFSLCQGSKVADAVKKWRLLWSWQRGLSFAGADHGNEQSQYRCPLFMFLSYLATILNSNMYSMVSGSHGRFCPYRSSRHKVGVRLIVSSGSSYSLASHIIFRRICTVNNKMALFGGAIVAAVVCLAISIYYIIPGYSHILVTHDPNQSHFTHAGAFFALAVICVIFALVMRPKSKSQTGE
jgi:hypothetical protein